MRVNMYYGYKIQMKAKLLNLFASEEIKMFKLSRPYITFDQLITLFKILSDKKLRRFELIITKLTY